MDVITTHNQRIANRFARALNSRAGKPHILSAQCTARIVVLGLFLFTTGCLPNRHGGFKNWFKPPAPNVLNAEITLPEVVDYLNANSTRIRSWQSHDVRLTVRPPGPAMPPIRLSAVIAVEAPKSFRLRAHNAFAEADLGSNHEKLWFFVRPSEDDAVIMARHEDVPLIQKYSKLPFDPDWLMEVLGVVPFDHRRMTIHHYGKKRDHCALSYSQLGADGQKYHRIVKVSKRLGQIIEHRLVDDAGHVIATAMLSDHRAIDGVVLPHKFKFDWPDTKNKMTLSLNDIHINDSMEPEMWNMPSNTKVVDLGRMIAQQIGLQPPARSAEAPKFEPTMGNSSDAMQAGGAQYQDAPNQIRQLGYEVPGQSAVPTRDPDAPVFEDANLRPVRPQPQRHSSPVQSQPAPEWSPPVTSPPGQPAGVSRLQRLETLRDRYRTLPDFN